MILEYEYDDPCRFCGETTHRRDCYSCDDGYIDEADDDPINFVPGEELRPCWECYGYGNLWWCPKCGKSQHKELTGEVASE